jgi:hypothetical protein
MNPALFGLLAGLMFGAITVLSMLPLSFADKTAALLGAFSSRFAIGFLIPFCRMPLPAYARGTLVGLLISLPDAVVSKSYVPIIGLGVIGGMLIGWLAGRYAGKPDI